MRRDAQRQTLKAILPALVVMSTAMAVCASAQTTQPAASPPVQEAARHAVTWGTELDASCRYIWHGIPYSTGAVLWPSAWVSTKGLTVTLWANIDPDYRHDKFTRTGALLKDLDGPVFNEYDLAAAYVRTFGRLTLTGTFSRYTYREPGNLDIPPGSTSEVIGRAAYTAGPGELFMTHSVDAEAHRGAYFVETGYGVDRELRPKTTLRVDGSIAFWSKFVKNYGFREYGSVGPATLNVAIVQQLTPAVSVRPHLTFMRLLSGNARRELGTPGVSGGIAVTFGY
jgi:hypothetical protein